jgi:TatA/E family protein of Tat protein translocase
MFGPLGFPELVFILVLALLIFGPKRLPEIGRTLGKGMAQFRRATTDLKRTIESEIALEEESPRNRPAGLPAPLPTPTPVAEARSVDEADAAPAPLPETDDRGGGSASGESGGGASGESGGG